jgi:type I restriction-modification system DNA methylase subunit
MLKVKSYCCKICQTQPDQISHHKSHLETQKHKDKKELFELKIKLMKESEIQDTYGMTDIDAIVRKFETHIEHIQESTKAEIMATPLVKKQVQNKVVWALEQNVDTNEQYNSIKTKLQSTIKQCHDILYSSCSVVGIKAQNDIMRILCLVLLKHYFVTHAHEFEQLCQKTKSKGHITDTQYNKCVAYCKDITLLAKHDNPLNEWKILVTKFLVHVLPSIYFEEDSKFNCGDENTIVKIIDILSKLDITSEFIDAFSTSCGDIHEAFRSYGGGKGAKELGQFFTPRQLIHLIFYGLGLKEIVNEFTNPTVYDPCMGTAGFLTRLLKLADISPEHVYGCETEVDTIKFGECSLMLATKSINTNVIKCDSLCQNPFLLDKKFQVIVTNPPFGTKMEYKALQEKFEKAFPNSHVKFSDIYPLKVNNGACLFVQHCVYMLEEGGLCAIVLPDGVLFDGNAKWAKTFRKWLCESVNVRTILKVPSGTFDHAGVKTNVVVFTKDGPTNDIQYLQTNKECTYVETLFTVSMVELKSTQYMLDVGEYIEDKLNNDYIVPMMELGEVCQIDYGTRIVKQNCLEGEFPVFGSGSESFTTNQYNREGFNVVVGRFALSPECVRLMNSKLFLNDSGMTLTPKNKSIHHRFVGYYWLFNQDRIFKIAKGQGQKNMNMDKFKQLKMPIPSLEVQHNIMQELSDIEQSINTIQKRLEQLKREKEQFRRFGMQIKINTLLKGCVEKKLCEVCEFENGKRIVKDKVERGDVPVYGGGDISFTTNIFNRQGRSCKISRDGMSPHNCVMLIDGKFFCNSQGMTINSATQTLLDSFLWLYLYFNMDKVYACGKGLAQKTLNIQRFRDLALPVPSLEVQTQCIEIYNKKKDYLKSLDEKIQLEKDYIQQLKNLGKDVIATCCS